MPDILLIQPPIEDFYLTAKRTMPYGLACIGAVLRKDGFGVTILDGLATDKAKAITWPSEMDFLKPFFGRSDTSPFALFNTFRHFGYSHQHLATEAKAAGAFLIGISSLFTAYSPSALATAAAVKKACPQAWIVLGGHHPTALTEEVLQHPAVDYVLRGDGEVGLPLLARALHRKGSLDKIPGLARRSRQGGIHQNPPAVVPDLNQTPLPAFDLIRWRYYQRKNAGSLAISTGRGCPLRCTYCAVNAATYHGFRQKSVSRVMAELEAAHARQPLGFIDFEDEHLSADKTWFLALLEAIHTRFGPVKPELRAMNGLFAPSLDDTLVAKMARAGFKTLNLALITTHTGQLKRFGRPDISADFDRVLALGHKHGLNSVAYIIVAGPHQDPYTTLEDLLFLAQRPVLAGLSVFYPAPGSADYNWCRTQGLLPHQPGLMRATALPLAHASDRVQTVTLLRLGRLLNFMKGLIDDGQAIPAADQRSQWSPTDAKACNDRQALGKMLLAAFLKDGTLFGRDDRGEFYPHLVDKALVHGFREGLGKIQIRGVRGRD